MNEYKYAGAKLDLFAAARNWKSYWSKQIRPLLKGDILEVCGGIGATTRIFDLWGTSRWVCLEPDPQLFAQLVKTQEKAGDVCGWNAKGFTEPRRHRECCAVLLS